LGFYVFWVVGGFLFFFFWSVLCVFFFFFSFVLCVFGIPDFFLCAATKIFFRFVRFCALASPRLLSKHLCLFRPFVILTPLSDDVSSAYPYRATISLSLSLRLPEAFMVIALNLRDSFFSHPFE